jgi:transcriptional regulator with XRE-family HTH domain
MYARLVEQLTSNVANNLKRLREAAGRTQEDVATAARRCGIKWGRSTVGMLEAGAYELKAVELVLLPEILIEAGIADVTLRSLLLGDGGDVQVTDRRRIASDELGRLLGGGRKASGIGWIQTSEIFAAGNPEHYPEAEQKAARKFGIHPALVVSIARDLWGQTLTEERDYRVAENAPADASARTIQALRAHATRELLAELEADEGLTAARIMAASAKSKNKETK